MNIEVKKINSDIDKLIKSKEEVLPEKEEVVQLPQINEPSPPPPPEIYELEPEPEQEPENKVCVPKVNKLFGNVENVKKSAAPSSGFNNILLGLMGIGLLAKLL